MTQLDIPQIYLITPQQFELNALATDLAKLLDQFPIACLRLSMGTDDAAEIGKAADLLRQTAHSRDVPIVIDKYLSIAETHGLDGVHIQGGGKDVRTARKALGPDGIVGAYAGNSRHEGLHLGEAGADYVSFGPLTQTALLSEEPPEDDVFAWWSEMVELPIVAEGAVTLERCRDLAPVTDFFALGHEIWGADNGPEAALKSYLDVLSTS